MLLKFVLRCLEQITLNRLTIDEQPFSTWFARRRLWLLLRRLVIITNDSFNRAEFDLEDKTPEAESSAGQSGEREPSSVEASPPTQQSTCSEPQSAAPGPQQEAGTSTEASTEAKPPGETGRRSLADGNDLFIKY